MNTLLGKILEQRNFGTGKNGKNHQIKSMPNLIFFFCAKLNPRQI